MKKLFLLQKNEFIFLCILNIEKTFQQNEQGNKLFTRNVSYHFLLKFLIIAFFEENIDSSILDNFNY